MRDLAFLRTLNDNAAALMERKRIAGETVSVPAVRDVLSQDGPTQVVPDE